MKAIEISAVAILFFSPATTHGWEAYGGSPGGGQYVPYDQINRDNVDQLELAWEHRSGDFSYGDDKADATTFETNPIFVNDKLYFCTAFGRVMALEPETGKEIWMFDNEEQRAGTPFGVHICRGVSYWENTSDEPGQPCNRRIVFGTLTGRVIAVDADNGARCQSFGINGEIRLSDYDYINPGALALSSPPAIIDNLLIVGGAVSSYYQVLSPNGIIRAFDVISGEEVWNWNPIPEHLQKKLGGVNVWPPMSVDTERDLVFLPTGSATVDPYGVHRKELLIYANALVALRASTGKVVWHYQIVHHDLWDNDMPAQPILVDARVNGNYLPAVIQFTKTGLMFAFQRETGEPLFKIEEKSMPASNVPGETASPTQPVPVKPLPLTLTALTTENAWGITFWDRGQCQKMIRPLRSEGLYTPPSLQGSVTLPNGYGGVNWGNAAYDPGRNWIIVNATQIANVSTLFPRADVEMSILDHSKFDVGGPLDGTPYQFKSKPILSPFGAPCTPPPWGTVTAIDLDTGDFVWQAPFGRVPVGPFRTPAHWGSPLIGGPIVTAGDLIFSGASLDHYLRALDIETGKVLWESDKLRAPANATPMSYMYNGKQYVVMAAGGNAIASTELSDSLVAYTLP